MVFGAGPRLPTAGAPGWLVACLSELATRNVNLTRIESRPRKQGLGRYMFFLDLEGRDIEPHVADALTGLRGHVQVLRVLSDNKYTGLINVELSRDSHRAVEVARASIEFLNATCQKITPTTAPSATKPAPSATH